MLCPHTEGLKDRLRRSYSCSVVSQSPDQEKERNLHCPLILFFVLWRIYCWLKTASVLFQLRSLSFLVHRKVEWSEVGSKIYIRGSRLRRRWDSSVLFCKIRVELRIPKASFVIQFWNYGSTTTNFVLLANLDNSNVLFKSAKQTDLWAWARMRSSFHSVATIHVFSGISWNLCEKKALFRSPT